MTYSQFKEMIKALDDGRSALIPFQLHDGLRNIQDNLGGWGSFLKFLEDVEKAEEPVIHNYNPPLV